MKKNIITILFLSIVGAQGINSNIYSFNTNVVLRPTENNIEVIYTILPLAGEEDILVGTLNKKCYSEKELRSDLKIQILKNCKELK